MGWPCLSPPPPSCSGLFPWTCWLLSAIKSTRRMSLTVAWRGRELLMEPMGTAWPFPFGPQDWEHTPTAVQAYVHTLQDELTQLRERVETLEARLTQNSTTSQRPPSSDSPYKKPRQRPASATPRK